MDDLGDLDAMIGGSQPTPPPGVVIAAPVSSGTTTRGNNPRADDRRQILQDEYTHTYLQQPTDDASAARKAADLDALVREHTSLFGRPPAVPSVAATVSAVPVHSVPSAAAAQPFDDLDEMIGTPAPQPAAPAPKMVPDTSQGRGIVNGIWDFSTAPARAALSMGTGMVAKTVSDIAGLAALAKEGVVGGGGDPEKFKEYVQDALTYLPKDKAAQLMASYNPLALIGKGVVKAGELAGDAVGGKDPGPLRSAAANFTKEAVPQAVGLLGAKVPDLAAGRLAKQTAAAAPSGGAGFAEVPLQGAAAEPIIVDPHGNATIKPTGAPAQPPIAPEIEIPRENPPMPTGQDTAEAIAARTAALNKVGITNIRKSAVGDVDTLAPPNPKEASSQYMTQKASQETYGNGMTAQINHEKDALDNHFSNIENSAGGQTVRYGTHDQVPDQMIEGQTVKSGLHAGKDAWNAGTSELYKNADAETGGQPAVLGGLNDYLNQKSNFAYEPERALRDGIKAYADSQGLLDDAGNLKPMTALQAEGIRKYINKKFNPATTDVAVDMKDAIDNDVFSQVGGPTYDAARAHFAKGKEVYENPNAMGKLLGDDGINEKVPDEKVMATMSALPEKQFGHIIDTLRNDGQDAALNQIQTSLVNQIHRAGQSAVNEPWNSIAAATQAAKLSGKLKVAFADKPELLQKVYDGIQAGNIVHIPTKYPGAAVQDALLKKNFIENAVNRGAGAAGGTAGGLVGPLSGVVGLAAGEHLGSKITNAMRGARQTKQLNQEIQYGQPSNGTNMQNLPK